LPHFPNKKSSPSLPSEDTENTLIDPDAKDFLSFSKWVVKLKTLLSANTSEIGRITKIPFPKVVISTVMKKPTNENNLNISSFGFLKMVKTKKMTFTWRNNNTTKN